jgi:soluble lytic murein transglycosylase-like protein
MWRRLLLVFLVTSATTGCFGRMAHYEDDPAAAKPIPGGNSVSKMPGFDGPTADVPPDRLEAFIAINNPFLARDLVKREADAITRGAAKNGVPTSLLASLIATESSFNPRAVSPCGAQGLGQLLPATAKDLGVADPFDPEQNIAGTAKYLAWLGTYWVKHPRRWELALASYLAGVGTVGNQLKAGRDLTAEQSTYVRKILQLSTRV